ncbi:MAG: heat-shock protein HtpX, partial [Solirubrobacterales bacterium]|nr:heat-shock protein HtpX [Solirubrobacterales bacterium]
TPTDRIHPEVIEVMHELDIDLADRQPQPLTRQLAERTDIVVATACGDQ